MGLCFQCTEGALLLKDHLVLSNTLHFTGSGHSLQAVVCWCLRPEVCWRGFIQIKQGLTIFKSHILLSAYYRHSCHSNNLLTKELQQLWMQGFLKIYLFKSNCHSLLSLKHLPLCSSISFLLSFLCKDPQAPLFSNQWERRRLQGEISVRFGATWDPFRSEK